MTQKFMLMAVTGYVLFAGIAAALAVQGGSPPSIRRQFSIMFMRTIAITLFVAGALGHTLLDAWGVEPLFAWYGPMAWAVISASAALMLLPALLARTLHGWWSPLPWLHGLLGATLMATWVASLQGPVHTLWPDWRFLAASALLWVVCLFVGDVALMVSHGARGSEPLDKTSRIYSELLRLCAAPPAILVYLLGFRL